MDRIPYILSLILLISFVRVDARIWTTVDGRTQTGELFEVEGEEVGIKIKGREYRFLINRFILPDRQYIREWSKVSRCHRCSKPIGNFRVKEAGSYKFHESCFKCLVCNKGFKGGEKLKRDEWGEWFMQIIFIRLRCVIPVRELFLSLN